MAPRPIYVEISIAGSVDEVWERTQDPGVHARWDLRFSSIRYLERSGPSAPQAFEYATRLGFGLRIEGTGESTGERVSERVRSSALRFGSEQRLSLIREGAGYWKYVSEGNRVRFLTQYSYRVRGGALGRLFDGVLFRPLIGWATAWSFDRLRIWIERGVDPVSSRRAALVSAAARIGLAAAWIYQGLVPKLLFPESGERDLVRLAGVPDHALDPVLLGVGVGEIVFGLLFLLVGRAKWLHVSSLLAVVLLPLGLLGHAEIAVAPFNPVALGIAMGALAVCGIVAEPDAPMARRCLRRPPEGERA